MRQIAPFFAGPTWQDQKRSFEQQELGEASRPASDQARAFGEDGLEGACKKKRSV